MWAESTFQQPLEFLKAISHELRWALITTLAQSDYRVQELVTVLQQPQNLISYHLKQLRNLQLVSERRSTADARDIYYSLELPQLQVMHSAIGQALHPALGGLNADTNTAIPARRVLFLCTENSARSQMAEAILRHLSGGKLSVFSAGTSPAHIHPYALDVLAELGIDGSHQRAKHVAELADHPFDLIITVCDRARENCPVFPNDHRRIHWSYPDPAAVIGQQAQYQAFQQTAAHLKTRCEFLLTAIKRDGAVGQAAAQ